MVADVFRSHDLWLAKAAWLLLIVALPLAGVLIYMLARGHKMSEHAVGDAREQNAAFRQYVRSAAATAADSVAKLEDLKLRGIVTDQEFERSKEKALH